MVVIISYFTFCGGLSRDLGVKTAESKTRQDTETLSLNSESGINFLKYMPQTH